MSEIVEESEIIDSAFDEFDPNEENAVILRTLVDFKIFSDNGTLISLEQLNKNAIIAHCEGTIVDPFSLGVRQKILKYASTISPKNVEDEIPMEVVDHTPIPEIPPAQLDRTAFKIGDSLDSYCNKTFKWFQAKICDINHEEKQVKVHFLRWKAKHDEWIDFNSDRLAALGSSKSLVALAAMTKNEYLPWFEPQALIQKAMNEVDKENGTKKKTKPFERSQRIRIDQIEDWCVDYTYANPSLWLISTSGIWYRVAGTLCPGGHHGRPAFEYSSVFKRTQEKYYNASHVVMCLLDIFPANHTVPFPVIVEEATVRSNGAVNEVSILTHYEFIAEQILSLERPAEWDKRVDLKKSGFLNHLRKEGALFHSQGGIEGLLRTGYVPRQEKSDLIYGNKRRQALINIYLSSPENLLERDFEDALQSEGEDEDGGSGKKRKKRDITSSTSNKHSSAYLTLMAMQNASAFGPQEDEDDGGVSEEVVKYYIPPKSTMEQLEEDLLVAEDNLSDHLNSLQSVHGNSAKHKENKHLFSHLRIRYPIEDSLYWRMYRVRHNGAAAPPLPLPKASKQLSGSITDKSSFLVAYTNLVNLREILDLPLLTVDSLEQLMLGGGTDPSGSIGLGAGGGATHPLLRDIHVKLLSAVIRHNEAAASASSAAATAASAQDGLGSTTVTKRSALLLPTDPVTGVTDASQLECFLRSGECWLETLRVLILERNNTNLSLLPEYLDPLAECKDIVEYLLYSEATGAEAVSFSHPVDPVQYGLTDYFAKIIEPMDLITVMDRILNKWYDPEPTDTLAMKSESNNGNKAINKVVRAEETEYTDYDASHFYESGQLIDVYNLELARWHEAHLVAVDYQKHTMTVRYTGWGTGHDEVIAFGSERLLPGKSVSGDNVRKRLTPEEVLSKFPHVFDQSLFPPAPLPLSKKSKHQGHAGVAYDIRLVFNNCQQYYLEFDATNPLIESAQFLIEIFEKQYLEKVLVPLDTLAEVTAKAAKRDSEKNDKVATAAATKTPGKSNGNTNGSASGSVNGSVNGSISTSATNSQPADAKKSSCELTSTLKQDLKSRLIREEPDAAESLDDIPPDSDDPSFSEWMEKKVEKAVLQAELSPEVGDTTREIAAHKSEWSALLAATQCTSYDYHSLSVEVKLQLLAWLCTEYLATTQCKAYLEEINDKQQQFEKEQRAVSRGRRPAADSEELDEYGVPIEQVSKSAVKRGRKPKDSSDSSGSLVLKIKGRPPKNPVTTAAEDSGDEDENAVSTLKTPAKKRQSVGSAATATSGSVGKNSTKNTSTESLSQHSTGTAAASEEQEELFDIMSLSVRHVPIGTDRNGNQYWVFHNDVVRPQIFCELSVLGRQKVQSDLAQHSHTKKKLQSYSVFTAADVEKGVSWVVYSTPTDIAHLVAWLCDKGQKEHGLKKAILAWVDEHNIILPSVASGKSEGAEEDEPIDALDSGAAPGSAGKRKYKKRKASEVSFAEFAGEDEGENDAQQQPQEQQSAEEGNNTTLNAADSESAAAEGDSAQQQNSTSNSNSNSGKNRENEEEYANTPNKRARRVSAKVVNYGLMFDEKERTEKPEKTGSTPKEIRDYLRSKNSTTSAGGADSRLDVAARQSIPAVEKKREIVVKQHQSGFETYWLKSEFGSAVTASATATVAVTPVSSVVNGSSVGIGSGSSISVAANAPLYLLMEIELPETNQLGMGVKESGGMVFVTNFQYSNPTKREGSAAKEAGVRIGDQIVTTNQVVIKSVNQLVTEVKSVLNAPATGDSTTATTTTTTSNSSKSRTATTTAAKSKPIIYMLIARSVVPLDVPSLKQLTFNDSGEIRTNLDEQSRLDAVKRSEINVLITTGASGGAAEAVTNAQGVLPTTPAAGSKKRTSVGASSTVTAAAAAAAAVSTGASAGVSSEGERSVLVPQSHQLFEQFGVPNRVVSSLLNMMVRAKRGFCVSEKWTDTHLPKWISKITTQLILLIQLRRGNAGSAISALKEANQQLVEILLACLIAFEMEIYNSHTVLPNTWGGSTAGTAVIPRDREQWRLQCSRTVSIPQLSYLISTLHAQINWTAIETAKSMAIMPITTLPPVVFARPGTITKSNAATTAPVKDTIFKLGSAVMYYGDGHLSFAKYLRSQAPAVLHSMWGATVAKPSESDTEWTAKLQHVVHKCLVVDVKVLPLPQPHSSDDVTSESTAGPFTSFAQVSLTILDHETKNSNTISNDWLAYPKPSKQYKYGLSRILIRILQILKKNTRYKSFLFPVNVREYPDYTETTEHVPIDLNMILKKAHNMQYNSESELQSDLQLLHDNNIVLNSNDYKKRMTNVLNIVEDCAKLIEIMKPELDALRSLRSGDTAEPTAGDDDNKVLDQNSISNSNNDINSNDKKNISSNIATTTDNSNIGGINNSSGGGSDSVATEVTSASGSTVATTAQSKFKKTIVVCIPLLNTNTLTPPIYSSSLLSAADFIVPFDRYFESVAEREVVCESLVRMSTKCRGDGVVGVADKKEEKKEDLFVLGSIVGTNALPNGAQSIAHLPWKHVQVEWHDLTDSKTNDAKFFPVSVNPWDFEVISTPTMKKFVTFPGWTN